MKIKKKQQIKDLPTLEEAIKKWHTPNTILELSYGEKEIAFSNPLSPIKSLQVRISSTETRNEALLHKLNNITRTIV